MAVDFDPPVGQESTTTPPIVYDPVPSTPSPTASKTVEVTRIPAPVLSGGRVIFPNTYGVDYTVDEKVVSGAMPHTSTLKVKAVARPGFRFAKGLKQTFNLKAK